MIRRAGCRVLEPRQSRPKFDGVWAREFAPRGRFKVQCSKFNVSAHWEKNRERIKDKG